MTWRKLAWMADENTYATWEAVSAVLQQLYNGNCVRKRDLVYDAGHFNPLLVSSQPLSSAGNTASQQMTGSFNRAMYHALAALEAKNA